MARSKINTKFPKVGSRAYFNDLRNNYGVSDTLPPGTSYVTGSNNLNYGIGGAYDANGQFLGFVRAHIGEGYKAYYDPATGAPLSITGPGDAPATPPASGGGEPPKFDGYTPDSFYTSAMQTLADNRARALASATEGERGLANDFGLGITQDDTGAKFTGTWAGSDANMGGIDPSNPFSRASLLNKSYFTAGKVGEGAYANRGLLTSGAYQRNQGRDAFRFESGKDQLLKQFASGLQSYRDRRSDAQNAYSTGTSQANLDLFGRNRDKYDRENPV